MDAYKKRFAYYALDRANIIPACVAYLGCVGMSWGDCHETSRPRQDNKFEKWCKESVCLSSTFWESNFSQKRKGWIFQTSLRILYNCKSTFIIIYWDMQKRHVYNLFSPIKLQLPRIWCYSHLAACPWWISNSVAKNTSNECVPPAATNQL